MYLPLPVRFLLSYVFLLLVSFHFKEVPLIFKAGLVVMNSFSFCLPGEFFISPSILNDGLAS